METADVTVQAAIARRLAFLDTFTQYQAVAEKIASNGRGVLPSGTEVKTVDTAQRGRVPYAERIDY